MKWFCGEIGISGFRFVPADYRYIAATRRATGPGSFRIHWGCTIGFTETEARHFRGQTRMKSASATLEEHLAGLPPRAPRREPGGPAGTSKVPEPKRARSAGVYELSLSGVSPAATTTEAKPPG